MKTKRFDCSPNQAVKETSGDWRITLRVVTDNSEHYASYSETAGGAERYCYGRYAYEPEQKDWVIGMSKFYLNNCKTALAAFSTKHNLTAHGAKTMSVTFNGNAALSRISENF